MKATPYLFFDNQCAEAFRFYAAVLGGSIEFLQTHGDAPMGDQAPPEWKDLVMHAHLVADQAELMGSDSMPGKHEPAMGTNVALTADSVDEAERIFRGLAEGGTVVAPIEKTFFAERFGMLVDRFGTPWMVVTAT